MKKKLNIDDNIPTDRMMTIIGNCIGGVHCGFWHVPQKNTNNKEKVYATFKVGDKFLLTPVEKIKKGQVELVFHEENVPANAYFTES